MCVCVPCLPSWLTLRDKNPVFTEENGLEGVAGTKLH